MITDETIDLSTAKFWCIFGDKKFKKLVIGVSKDKVNEMIDPGSIMMFSGLLFTGMNLFGLVEPYLKNAWRKFTTREKDMIAKVEFTADGNDYTCSFDIKSMKWKLISTASTSREETLSFFQTSFFKQFCLKCKKILENVFSKKNDILKSISKMKDQHSKEFLYKLLKSQREIEMNMFAVKYMT